jgi:hypothetical protein
MPATLSDELQQAVEREGGRPVEVIHPGTQKVYLLMPREQYERLKPLFEDDRLSPSEQRRLLSDAGRRAGWDDPGMNAYDEYDQNCDREP